MTPTSYRDPAGLRTALERRLLARARAGGLPLDRLRKEAAMQRFLARLVHEGPPGGPCWALKGGLAMIARVGERARATADADTTWRAGTRELTAWLEQAAAVDLGDHFEFFLGEPRAIQAEGPEGGLRFAVQARVAGRLFERIRLDVNVVVDDPRPVEVLALRNLFDFADLPAVIVPAIRPEQQLTEKLHAYTRDYGRQENSRAKDLDAPDSLELLAKAPDPAAAARLTAAQIGAALKRARRRNRDEKVAAIRAALRTEHLGRSGVVTGAYAATVQAQVAILTVLNQEITTLESQVEAHFGQHPDAEIYTSQPGLGVVLGARVLAEFGDDPHVRRL